MDSTVFCKVGTDKERARLQHSGVVSFHFRESGVLHCTHRDQKRAAVLGATGPSQRDRPLLARVWWGRLGARHGLHGQALFLVAIPNVPTWEAA